MLPMSELSISDFTLDGEYGSNGSRLEKIGRNHFQITLGSAPNQPTWFNKPQFIISQNARDNQLVLDVIAPAQNGGQYPITEYSYSWSYDNENWHPLALQTSNREKNRFVFPAFTEDVVYFGHQVPFSYEKLQQYIELWAQSPYVSVHKLGVSLGGRNLYRLEMTHPDSSIPRSRRWGHYIVHTHPGEHNAQWRMIGMIDWLLHDPEAESFLHNSICHFNLMMSPDGPSNGWYRVNAQGIDMNRSYKQHGSDQATQAHEAYICQKDLEHLMASGAPIQSIWNMHTWGGIVEPILYPGPELSQPEGKWHELRDAIAACDPHKYVKILRCADQPQGLLEGWNGGPQYQFGITGILCEGGGGLLTKQENMDSGKAIIRGISQFYHQLSK